MIARRYVVSGVVQGVGFRWFVVRRARALRLSGNVRNLRDGRVEVTAAGEEADLHELEALLNEGPSLARVTAVEVSDTAVADVGPARFDVK